MRTMFAAAMVAAFPGVAAAAETALERGKYLATIMSCGDCHSGRLATGEIDPGKHLTGATIGFEMPGLGIFWPANLTPDRTGLGDWTDEQVLHAIRTGERSDGRQLVPAMPWHMYSVLTDEDGAALVAYLRSLPPTENRVPGPIAPDEQASLPFYRVMPPSAPKTN